jgi:hypothetical protein
MSLDQSVLLDAPTFFVKIFVNKNRTAKVNLISFFVRLCLNHVYKYDRFLPQVNLFFHLIEYSCKLLSFKDLRKKAQADFPQLVDIQRLM